MDSCNDLRLSTAIADEFIKLNNRVRGQSNEAPAAYKPINGSAGNRVRCEGRLERGQFATTQRDAVVRPTAVVAGRDRRRWFVFISIAFAS